jgi:hypothetical protein
MGAEDLPARQPHYWFGDGSTKLPITTAVMLAANNQPITLKINIYRELKHELFVLGQYVFDDLVFNQPSREEGNQRLAVIDDFSKFIMDSVELDNQYSL